MNLNYSIIGSIDAALDIFNDGATFIYDQSIISLQRLRAVNDRYRSIHSGNEDIKFIPV